MTLIFMLHFSYLRSQTYFFETYSGGGEQGLGSSKVYSVIQDRNDWIWCGTDAGISRFNGSRFENFTTANGIAGESVYCIMEDTIGRVWFGHLYGSGLTLFDGKDFRKVTFDSIIISGDINSISQLKNYIWITTSNNGAVRIPFPARGETMLTGKVYSGREGLSDLISSSYLGRNGDYYCILPNTGIKKYNRERDLFENFKPDGLPGYFAVIVMFQDSGGDLWFGTHNGGLYRKIASTGEMKVYDSLRDGLAGNYITSITEDSKRNIWVGTWDGGGITVISNDNIKVYNRSNGLEATAIHCILEDKEKNIIIADHNTGLSVFKGDHFITYSDEKVLPDKKVYAIEEDESGRYWFGTNAGISLYNPASEISEQVQFFTKARYPIGNDIRFLKSDRNGNVWIGTETNGLFSYDTKLKKFIFDPIINSQLGRTITALAVDKNSRLWIGNMDRLVVLDRTNKDTIITYTQGSGLAGNSIKVLYCDNNNNVWIGSEEKSGLTKYEDATGEFKIINIGSGNVPQAIAQTTDSRIWVGTTSAGLLCIQDDSVSMTLTNESGLLSNNIKLLQPEGGNYLYIGTNSGLNRYNLSNSSISSFTKRNGFAGIEASTNASIRDTKGNLWFGTTNGITMLAPDRMPELDTKPVVHISRMEVNYLPREMGEGLKLNFREKSLIFYYYSVSLTNPDAVRYKVMLKGADADWRPATHETMADYPNLAPGHYTFSVMASNSYGYWNEQPVEYSFIIMPPFYQNPLFVISCIFLALFGVIAYIKIREQNLIREKKILEAKVEERTAEVVQKSEEIEQKNRDITASIRYAERIQRAMLPRDNVLLDTFVLFMPKDIVSGDFYWMYDNGDWQFIAAVDCTGHGVPGAFMSIIGHNSLNKVVKEYGLIRPAAILNQLNTEVVKALKQRNEETITDGMDLTLIAFNRKDFILEFAGAYNSLYSVRNGVLTVHKGDRFPIGMTSIEDRKQFLNQRIDIQPGDMIYMCTDGYADQFGTTEGKKYKSGNVKRLLRSIWNLPVCDQRTRLEKEILDWKGENPQVDDILVIGMRIPEC
ncbi:MAG: SpoIIE family protein phosphatase [Bacteroidales bacterium]|nr:SpoIIE family protein phosphatase [Bacteroidales bacterium]